MSGLLTESIVVEQGGSTALIKAMQGARNIYIVRLLLSAGAAVNDHDKVSEVAGDVTHVPVNDQNVSL
jgi:hypothetical protein